MSAFLCMVLSVGGLSPESAGVPATFRNRDTEISHRSLAHFLNLILCSLRPFVKATLSAYRKRRDRSFRKSISHIICVLWGLLMRHGVHTVKYNPDSDSDLLEAQTGAIWSALGPFGTLGWSRLAEEGSRTLSRALKWVPERNSGTILVPF